MCLEMEVEMALSLEALAVARSLNGAVQTSVRVLHDRESPPTPNQE